MEETLGADHVPKDKNGALHQEIAPPPSPFQAEFSRRGWFSSTGLSTRTHVTCTDQVLSIRVGCDRSAHVNQLLLQYSYLQILDFLTTIALLPLGVREGNPLVRLALPA